MFQLYSFSYSIECFKVQLNHHVLEICLSALLYSRKDRFYVWINKFRIYPRPIIITTGQEFAVSAYEILNCLSVVFNLSRLPAFPKGSSLQELLKQCYHILHNLKNKDLSSYDAGAWKIKIKVWVGLVSSEQQRVSSLRFHTDL